MARPKGELQPNVEQAQETLREALREACSVDVRKVNTGELIRVDEMLAIASTAAKELVSVRLKRRNERSRKKTSVEKAGRSQAGEMGDIHPPEGHLTFADTSGRRWRAFAVRPSSATVERASLPDAFRHGWLAFESSSELRRFAPIPADWEALSTDELRSLCQQAEPSPKRVARVDKDRDPEGPVR